MKKKKIHRLHRIPVRNADLCRTAPAAGQLPPQDTFRDRLQRYYEMLDREDNWLIGWVRYRIDPERWDPRPQIVPEERLERFEDETDNWYRDWGEEEW